MDRDEDERLTTRHFDLLIARGRLRVFEIMRERAYFSHPCFGAADAKCEVGTPLKSQAVFFPISSDRETLDVPAVLRCAHSARSRVSEWRRFCRASVRARRQSSQ
jgi:hypothetical protein